MVARQETRESIGRRVDLEGNPASIGVVLAIVGMDPSRNGENITSPKLWTVRELKTKPETQKTAGQLSFPAETRKKTPKGQEPLARNIIAALVEEFSDDPRLIERSLFFMNGSSVVGNTISVQNGPLDLVVLIHEGPMDRRIQPADVGDVEAHGWMSMEELKAMRPNKLRNFVSQTIEAERSEQVISRVIRDYLHAPFLRVPIASFLNQDFSIPTFRAQREYGGIDVVGKPPLPISSILFERH